MKKHLILLGVLLSTQLSMAEDLAPTKTKIISQDDSIAWIKFRDNSDGDFFRFYLDGKTNSSVIGDRKDTTWRNGKSRVVPFKLKKLDPKTYKVTIGVIKDNKKVAESKPFDLVIGGGGDSSQAPTISKVFKGSERYTWVKFKDNSNGDLFRFYFNGEANQEAIKDFKDTTTKNGKYRVVPINVTKLAPNTKFNVTIGVIKDDKKIAESKAFTIDTGDAVDLRERVIEYNRENGTRGSEFHDIKKVNFFFDNHFVQIVGTRPEYGLFELINFYRIDDDNSIKPIPALPFTELDNSTHQYMHIVPYDNDTKLQIYETTGDSCNSRYYDVKDLDNITFIGENLDDLSCTVIAETELSEKVKKYDFAQMSSEEQADFKRDYGDYITTQFFKDRQLVQVSARDTKNDIYYMNFYRIKSDGSIHSVNILKKHQKTSIRNVMNPSTVYIGRDKQLRLTIFKNRIRKQYTTYYYDVSNLDNITFVSKVEHKGIESNAPASFDACGVCHGSKGEKTALGRSSIIGGQSKKDITNKINAYKAGTRNITGMGFMMKGKVEKLTDTDIEEIATYLSEIK